MTTKQSKTARKVDPAVKRKRRLFIALNVLMTITFFTVEALMHYNVGKNGKLGIRDLPGTKQMVEILATVAFFTLLSMGATILLTKALT